MIAKGCKSLLVALVALAFTSSIAHAISPKVAWGSLDFIVTSSFQANPLSKQQEHRAVLLANPSVSYFIQTEAEADIFLFKKQLPSYPSINSHPEVPFYSISGCASFANASQLSQFLQKLLFPFHSHW